ncbi:hypothetical protein OsI_37754 [Oryza sativa Indica Group]|uniref:Uncharacterized protein n=1 Tax=Oryza sativa subsp. indica TaxID=39946 RepID=A2ZIU6_ORYSI|nr:hypothetical protein OsI_37754 [Oryza sativa Indica Group]
MAKANCSVEHGTMRSSSTEKMASEGPDPAAAAADPRHTPRRREAFPARCAASSHQRRAAGVFGPGTAIPASTRFSAAARRLQVSASASLFFIFLLGLLCVSSRGLDARGGDRGDIGVGVR